MVQHELGAADAQWGLIRVKAIIKNGKITDVQFYNNIPMSAIAR